MSPMPLPPGRYVEETAVARPIAGVATSITAFIGRAGRGPLDADAQSPVAVTDFAAFQRVFGAADPAFPMSCAVRDFFANGGRQALVVRLDRPAPDDADAGLPLEEADYLGDADAGTGLHALRRAELFNLLCIPPDAINGDAPPAVLRAALALCVERRAMLVVDPPAAWCDAGAIVQDGDRFPASLGIDGVAARNAVMYFPRLREPDPAHDGEVLAFAPCGAVAGVMARSDFALGVWRAPAGIDATLEGVPGLDVALSDPDNERLNQLGINCLRDLPKVGPVVWGARTLRGADGLGDEYKYLPVRRLALHIEESLLRGTAWAAFEPGGERLWARLRAEAGAFMRALFDQGAFQGATPAQAYCVRCDASTTTASDAAMGVANVEVGFAPLRPSEFLVLRLAVATAPAP